MQRQTRASTRSSPLRFTPSLRETAVASSGATAPAIASAAITHSDVSQDISVGSHSKTASLISAATEILSSIESAESSAAGDLGFTVYPSLSGDYCVDFVPPAVDLSVNVSDRLMEVDGVSTRGKSPAEVTNMMRGRVGSYATIKLFRFPPSGSPFFVETSLLRLPVLSEELRASMYSNYTTSRKAFAELHASKPTAQTQASLSMQPEPSQPPALAPPPIAASSSPRDSVVCSTNVSLSKPSPVPQMDTIHVWTKESLAQVAVPRALSLVADSPRSLHPPPALQRAALWVDSLAVVALDCGSCRKDSGDAALRAASSRATLSSSVAGSVIGAQGKATVERLHRNSLRLFVSSRGFRPRGGLHFFVAVSPFATSLSLTAAQALDSSKEHSFVVYSPQSTLDVFMCGYLAPPFPCADTAQRYGMTPPAAFNLVIAPDGNMLLQAPPSAQYASSALHSC
jgi:hypothetical protein